MPHPAYRSGAMSRRANAAALSSPAMPDHSAWPALLVTAGTGLLSRSSAWA